MKKNEFKNILLYTLFVFLVMFAVMVDTKAEEVPNNTEGAGKVYDQSKEISDANTLCNATFDVPVKKYGTSTGLAQIGMELENINKVYQICRDCMNTSNVDKSNCGADDINGCATNRYNSYKKLAQKCEMKTKEDKEQLQKECEVCKNWNPNIYEPGAQDLSQICTKDSCKNYVEEQKKAGSSIEEKDLDSCIKKCNADYFVVTIFSTTYKQNKQCQENCTNYYQDTSSENSEGSTNSGGPNIHIGALTCEGIADLTAFAGKVYRIGMVFLVVGFVILSMLDYGKAVMSDNQDVMKKANKHFVTRIIILAIYVFLPLLITMIIKVIFPNMTVCLNF